MAPKQNEEESVEFCLGSLMPFIVTPIPLIVIILRSIARRWPYHLRCKVLFLRASVIDIITSLLSVFGKAVDRLKLQNFVEVKRQA